MILDELYVLKENVDEPGNTVTIDKSNGSPYDRGGADAWYHRGKYPHKIVNGQEVKLTDPREIQEYLQGYENEGVKGRYQGKQYEAAEQAPTDNFTIDDIKQLERIRDFEALKTQAKQLIKGKPVRRMKPEKIAYFHDKIDSLSSPLKVIKLMYDLLLAGEGHQVIGSAGSMSRNTYRQRFGEEAVSEGQDLELYGLRVGDTVKAKINGKRVQGDVIDIFPDSMEVELLLRGANAGKTITVDVRATESLDEQAVAEGGTLKKIKRGLAGWGAFDKDSPKDVVQKNKAYDTDTLKLLKRGASEKPGQHSPRDLQTKVIDRELKRRGVAENADSQVDVDAVLDVSKRAFRRLNSEGGYSEDAKVEFEELFRYVRRELMRGDYEAAKDYLMGIGARNPDLFDVFTGAMWEAAGLPNNATWEEFEAAMSDDISEGVTSPEIKQAYADIMKTQPGSPERKAAVRAYQKLRADAMKQKQQAVAEGQALTAYTRQGQQYHLWRIGSQSFRLTRHVNGQLNEVKQWRSSNIDSVTDDLMRHGYRLINTKVPRK